MRTLLGFYILCLLLGQDLADDVTQNLCFTNRLSDFLPPPYSNISDSMPCTPLWNTFVLRYSENRENVMTIILSALYTTGWVGVGFSRDGRMVGSSAMVGWITKKGHAKIKQYYLQGTERDQVVPDQGELQLQKVPPVVALHGAMIYLAFQVKFTVKVPRRAVILAFSSAYPSKLGRLSKHDDKTTVIVDLSKGIDPNMTMLILVLNFEFKRAQLGVKHAGTLTLVEASKGANGELQRGLDHADTITGTHQEKRSIDDLTRVE
ncbi:hypothetical protein F2Q69_00049697 [Brassica cretica]|uniref:DOMON domain-containing protein n=1 Tax=Brassica cretica TaxID=69181 RepID=A0A8S9PR13_BRACR|nr:hypothetical protein F2Q69_00049697 [Brassica cretica]